MRNGLKVIVILLAFPAILVMIGLVALHSYTTNRPTVTSAASRDQATPIPSIRLERNSALTIGLPLPTGGSARFFNFRAHPQQQTRVNFASDTPDYEFAAELRDDAGQAVARLNSTHLQTVEFLIEPGDELYLLTVSSVDPESRGEVSLVVDEPQPPPSASEMIASVCGLISAHELGNNIYSGPRPEYAVMGVLQPGEMLAARGRIRGGWYLTEHAGQSGWVAGEDVHLYGACNALPIVLDPTIPAAPADREPYFLSLDRDGQMRLVEAVSYPNDDPRDFIWINVLNLHHQAPNNYREIAFTLHCEGVGAEALRWGAPENPTFECGEAMTLPFMHDHDMQPLVVVLPDGVEQSYVEYELIAISTTQLNQ